MSADRISALEWAAALYLHEFEEEGYDLRGFVRFVATYVGYPIPPDLSLETPEYHTGHNRKRISALLAAYRAGREPFTRHPNPRELARARREGRIAALHAALVAARGDQPEIRRLLDQERHVIHRKVASATKISESDDERETPDDGLSRCHETDE